MELIKSISIENLLSQRNAIEERITKAQEVISEAEKIAQASQVKHAAFLLYSGGSYFHNIFSDNGVPKFMRELDARIWDHLLAETGMKSFMCASARKQWSDDLEKGVHPPLTIENIAATFSNIHHSRQRMLEEGILESFRKLSWDYKTNSPRMFGKRIIFGSLNSSCDRIDDLLRVFYIFDGKPEPEYRHRISERISVRRNKGQDSCENEFIKLRWFKKGSGHLTFKRLDLVKKCNEILARHFPNALPPPER